jgi:hypothetical protein
MSDRQELTLDNPRVQNAKRQFEKGNYARKRTLTFDELFERFKRNATLTSVAKEMGVTQPAAAEMHKRHFLKLLGSVKESTDRRMQTKRENRLKLEKEKLFHKPRLVHIVKEASKRGCEVDVIPTDSEDRGKDIRLLRMKTILINGYVCAIHRVANKTKSPFGSRSYAKVNLSLVRLEETDVTIIRTEVRGHSAHTFVIPNNVLIETFFKNCTKRILHVSVPLENLPVYNNKQMKLPYWQYESRWDLLPPKLDPPVP